MSTTKSIQDFYCRIQYMIARELFQELNQKGFPYAVIKGCPLAYYKTGNPGTRLSGDIDILLPRQNVKEIKRILSKMGYTTSYEPDRKEKILMMASSHQVLPYSKSMGNFELQMDVNFDLFWGEYKGIRIDINEFLNDAVWMDMFGYEIRTLPPLKMLVQLLLHHYKEMNSLFYLTHNRPIKKRFFEDVYLLCKRYDQELNVQNVYDISCKYDILPYVYYVFYYTKEVYNDSMLDKYLAALYSLEGEYLLNYYGLTNQERKEWKLDFKERLEQDISDYIQGEMTNSDIEKLGMSRKLFGFDIT